ncbi:MAG: hypothetical protein ACK5H7_37355, partial [Bradyrhizobium sp.]
MTLHLDSQDVLEDAVRTLVTQDKRLAPILAATGMPALRRREPGFAGIAHIVCGQQLSTASAADRVGIEWVERRLQSAPYRRRARGRQLLAADDVGDAGKARLPPPQRRHAG